MDGIELSMVIPAYNEARRLPRYLRSVRDYLATHFADRHEVIIVDDGSRDDLAKAVEDVDRIWNSLRIIRHAANRGKGAAVRTGVLPTRGALVLMADADGATPIQEEGVLRQAIDHGADIAVGSRMGSKKVQRDRVRRIAAAVFSRRVRSMFGLDVRDTQCGFKMFRGDIGRDLFGEMCEDGYLFDIEMLLLASQRGLRIAEVPIEWHEMPGGKLSLWRDAWSMHRQLRRLHRKVSRIPRFHFEVSRKTLDTGSSNP